MHGLKCKTTSVLHFRPCLLDPFRKVQNRFCTLLNGSSKLVSLNFVLRPLDLVFLQGTDDSAAGANKNCLILPR